jgi:hypothetical protein
MNLHKFFKTHLPNFSAASVFEAGRVTLVCGDRAGEAVGRALVNRGTVREQRDGLGRAAVVLQAREVEFRVERRGARALLVGGLREARARADLADEVEAARVAAHRQFVRAGACKRDIGGDVGQSLQKVDGAAARSRVAVRLARGNAERDGVVSRQSVRALNRREQCTLLARHARVRVAARVSVHVVAVAVDDNRGVRRRERRRRESVRIEPRP